MSKSKASSKSAKPAKADVLTKVKDAVVTKPAQQVKAKSKQIAKAVAEKEGKQSKKSKKMREPTPESSEDDSASSESSSSDSEEEVVKHATNGNGTGTKKAAVPESDDDDDSASDEGSDDDSSDDEAPTANGKVKASSLPKTTKTQDSDDSSDASSEDSNEESDDESDAGEKPNAKATTKAVKDDDRSEESASSDDDDQENDSESSDADSEEDIEVKSKPTKRKAEEEAQPVAKKTKTADGDTPQSANLFVGNVSWNVDEAWLREVFEEFGEVARVQLMTDRATGRSKGFGYVEFANHEDAVKAHAAKQGADLDGRALNVDFANARPATQDRQDNRRKSYGDQVGEASDTLFLGNLSFDVGQEAVTEAFAPHGTILGIRLPTDRETGQPKGFGYVTFSTVDEATAALEAMQGAYIASRPVRLDYSQPRPQNGDSPARGRGGFGGRGAGRGGRGDRGGFGGRGGRGGRGGFGGRGGRGGAPRGNTTNRGGFGDFSGRKVSFD